MKTYLFSATAVLILAACNKETSSVSFFNVESALDSREISVNTATAKTKGYLAGTTFFDTSIAALHGGSSDEPESREMMMSAYVTPQSGTAGNYFVDFTFKKGDLSDDYWHHTPAVYWPIAGTLDFLAYSAKEPFDAKDVAWNEKNATESLVLNVRGDRTQDDIVFSYAYGQGSADGSSAVPMKFQHTQAWIEFNIKVASADMKEKIAIKEIVIENAFDTGELTVKKTGDRADASWSFCHEQSKNIVFEDNYSIYGTSLDGVLNNALKDEISYMDMLLPQQNKTSFVIKYFLAGQDKVLQYRYDLSTPIANWEMGKKYIYSITFTVNEITVAPDVQEYADGIVTDLDPKELV